MYSACANIYRFRAFQGNVSRSNDNKTMASRREALIEQLEARGESVDADNTFLLGTAASAAIFVVSLLHAHCTLPMQ